MSVKADGSRVVPEFNLSQYLAANQSRNEGVAPYITLQFAEMKTSADREPFREYPKCVTLPDGQKFTALDEAQEKEVVKAYEDAAKAASARGASASGGAGGPGPSGKA